MSWPTAHLGELARPRQWPILSKAEMVEAGFPVYGANGQIGYSSKFTHDSPTILVGCRGSCGTVHVTPPKAYANGNAMALDALDTNRINLRFLYLFLRKRGFDDVISGSSQPQITGQNIVRIEVPLPPLDEQRRIAAILDQADALRRKRREALSRLSSLAPTTFRSMFGAPGLGAEWPVRELRDVVRAGTIVTYGMVQAGDEFNGGVPYIRTGDIVDGEIVAEQLRRADPVIAAKFERARVEPDDIVMSIRATVGTTALVPEHLNGANLTQGTARISPGSLTNSLYLLHFLRSEGAQSWIQQQVKGATFREITLNRLRELPVTVPPLELQMVFVQKVRAIEKAVVHSVRQASNLDTLFASLQQRAFRGEL